MNTITNTLHAVDIRAIRRSLGDTQRQFAKRLEVRQATVSAWETGHEVPSYSNTCAIVAIRESKIRR